MRKVSNEALHILQEELAEGIAVISKIVRFGWNSYHPTNLPIKTNTQHLIEEIGDILALIDIVAEAHGLDEDEIAKAKLNKIIKLKTWSTLFEKEK